ncbi:MAG: penicillin acylase family protein [Gemmatimonadales bacterium]
MRALLDAFAAGLNAYLADHPDVRPRLLTRFEPWYPLAFIRFNYYQNGFLYGSGLRQADLEAAVEDVAGREDLGSNGWVIGPSRSATGNAMLFINPHLPFFGSGQVYEGHVNSKESGWNFTGYTRFGFPFPYEGHNESVGWVSTDNAADLADLYLETFDDPARPLAYRTSPPDPLSATRRGGTYRQATAWTDTILVKTDTGVVRRVFTFRKTHHGPIIATRDGKPLALRMAKFEADGWLQEWYDMTRARSVAELKAAMRPLNMQFGNVMAADAGGNTWYLYNGAVPIRDPRFDWSGPVDGSDPATEWKGYHTLEELPQLTNPATGGMQNCNTTPFLLTSRGNPDSSKFPRYMMTEGDNSRGLVSRRILAATPRFTWDEWVRAAFDTYVISADSLLPGLLRDDAADAGARRSDAGRDRDAPALESASGYSVRGDDAIRSLAGRAPRRSAEARRAGQRDRETVARLGHVAGAVGGFQSVAADRGARRPAVRRRAPQHPGDGCRRPAWGRVHLCGAAGPRPEAAVWRGWRVVRQRRGIRPRGAAARGAYHRGERRSTVPALLRSGAAVCARRVPAGVVYARGDQGEPGAGVPAGRTVAPGRGVL